MKSTLIVLVFLGLLAAGSRCELIAIGYRQSSTAEQSARLLQNPIGDQAQLYPDGPIDLLPLKPAPSDLSALPLYSSPDLSQDNSMFLSHDMKGGYKEDTNIYDRFPHDNTTDAHHYRALHLPQSRIFNYFSHHLITVPPKLWRDLCHKQKVLCLGTFILEAGRLPKQEDYLSNSTADLLVYLARRYQFDGYLVNIERGVNNVTKLTTFLKRLVSRMHKEVPNSQIVWYDSVIKTGQLAYQNELNQNNEMFYQICDSIFLNYWWNQEKIKRSLKRSVPGKRVYVGNDCHGRGTFGGGKYNISAGIQMIRKVNLQNTETNKYPLIPALFGMAFTYENGGIEDRQIWRHQESKFYRAQKPRDLLFSENITHDKWKYTTGEETGNAWILEGEWAVTSWKSSERVHTYSLKEKLKPQWNGQLSIVFKTTIAGKWPSFNDTYNVKLRLVQLLNGKKIIRSEVSTGNKTTTQSNKLEVLSILANVDLFRSGNAHLEIVQQGSDAESWEGYYGARFKDDQISFATIANSGGVNWINPNIPSNSQGDLRNFAITSLPYTTTFSIGLGDHFYYKGKTLEKSDFWYDYLSDSDPLHPYFLNNPEVVEIFYKEAYYGGTSLKLNFDRAEQNKLFLMAISQSAFINNSKSQIIVKLAVKPLRITQIKDYAKLLVQIRSQNGLELTLGSKGIMQLQYAKPLQNSQWLELTYSLSISNNLRSDKSLINMGWSGNQLLQIKCKTFINEWLISSFEISDKVQSRESITVTKVKIVPVKDQSQQAGVWYADITIQLKTETTDDVAAQRMIFKVGNSYACFVSPDPIPSVNETPNQVRSIIIIKRVKIVMQDGRNTAEMSLSLFSNHSLNPHLLHSQKITPKQLS